MSGTKAKAVENPFTNENSRFIGWNTEADGSGDWYYPQFNMYDRVLMNSNRVLYAQWENLYNVTYVVAEDPVYGSPADAPVPAQKTDIVYNTTVTLEADLTTDWNTSTGKDDAGVPGTWSYTGWSTDTTYADDLTEKVILKDETVYGKWVFTPNAYTVTYVFRTLGLCRLWEQSALSFQSGESGNKVFQLFKLQRESRNLYFHTLCQGRFSGAGCSWGNSTADKIRQYL